MGLSDEERLDYMYHAVSAIVHQSRRIKKMDGADTLVFLCNELWPAALNKVSNPTHWIFGSSATNPIEDDSNSIWSKSIDRHIERHNNSVETDTGHPFDEQPFDCFEGFLCISNLLSENESAVYEIFSWTEQLSYALRRYNDDFRSQYNVLDDLISRIQGECFSLFFDNEDFAKAYILNSIAKMLYGNFYPYQEKKWDVVTKWLSKDHVHHDLNRPMKPDFSLKELLDIHGDLNVIKTMVENHKPLVHVYRRKRVYYTLQLCRKKAPEKLIELLTKAKWSKAEIEGIKMISHEEDKNKWSSRPGYVSSYLPYEKYEEKTNEYKALCRKNNKIHGCCSTRPGKSKRSR